MRIRHRLLPLVASGAGIGLATLMVATPAAAHESRTVSGIHIEVGFIGEPASVGQPSGLELIVDRGGAPVSGVQGTAKADVTYGSQRRDLTLDPVDGQPGMYHAAFVPTAAGSYTFHVTGTIAGTSIDERFTSGPQTFADVADARAAQFPVQLRPAADVAADAERGAAAAGQFPVAIALGAVGTILGLVAIGLALGRRQRTS